MTSYPTKLLMIFKVVSTMYKLLTGCVGVKAHNQLIGEGALGQKCYTEFI